MRGYNQEPERPRPIFSRSADGRLRAGASPVAPSTRPAETSSVARPQPIAKPAAPVTTSPDIGDMWTEQERIRIKEGWEYEQKKAARKQRRKTLFNRKKSKGEASPAAPAEPKELNLTISVPALPSFRFPALPKVHLTKKQALIAGAAVAVVIVAISGYIVFMGMKSHRAGADTSGVKIEHLDPAKQTGKPDYDTVLPNGKGIEELGGWVRVSPPEKNPVYAYADKLNNVLINVSEQPIPDAFKGNPTSSMENLAKQFSANNKVTAGNLTVYIGTSAKGPQSVLFVKDDLLILMKSASKIPDQQWVSYVESLQ